MADHERPSDVAVFERLPPATGNGEDDEISLIDIAIVMAKHKKLILGLPIVAGLFALGITFLMPKWYTATTKCRAGIVRYGTGSRMQ